MRILVVEDNLTELNPLCELLRATGHEVIATSRAEDAERFLELNSVDVVLVDLLLRGLDAFSFIRGLKKGSAKPAIPVIAMSSETRWPVDRISREFGCVGFLRKPVVEAELAAQLAAVAKAT